MHRRELFRILGAGAALPALSPNVFALFQQAQPGSNYALRTLSPPQNELVVAMIDQIIPATETPGAKGARVNEFIDVILTEWATPEERANFLAGLADVERTLHEEFRASQLRAAGCASPCHGRRFVRDETSSAPRVRHARRTRHAAQGRFLANL